MIIKMRTATATSSTTIMMISRLVWTTAIMMLSFRQMSVLAAKPLVAVECPSELRQFTAVTDLILVGRTSLLSEEERAALNFEFQTIYNTLTQQNCDGYFRRIGNVGFVNQTNLRQLSLYDPNGLDNAGDNNNNNNNNRHLQSNTSASSVNQTISSSGGDIAVTYDVTGTCRNCPLTESGSFELYDEAFRRRRRRRRTLQGKFQWKIQTRHMKVTPLGGNDRHLQEQDDCLCAEGTLPTEARAPGVQECVDEMNGAFDTLRESQGLFQDLEMTNLQQLDDLSGIQDALAAGLTTTSSATSHGSSNPMVSLGIMGIVTTLLLGLSLSS